MLTEIPKRWGLLYGEMTISYGSWVEAMGLAAETYSHDMIDVKPKEP